MWCARVCLLLSVLIVCLVLSVLSVPSVLSVLRLLVLSTLSVLSAEFFSCVCAVILADGFLQAHGDFARLRLRFHADRRCVPACVRACVRLFVRSLISCGRGSGRVVCMRGECASVSHHPASCATRPCACAVNAAGSSPF